MHMKITIIHGQNHKGSSYHIGRKIADSLTGESDVFEFFLPKAMNHFCTACFNCLKDETTCPFYKDKLPIIEAIKQSDLLIFTTPVYALRASAGMKTFLDLMFTFWMTHKPKDYIFEKRAVIIATSAGSSGRAAVNDIKTSLSYWGISSIETFSIPIQAFSLETIKPERMQIIDKATARIISRQKKLQQKKSHVSIKTKFMFSLFAGMQKANWGASPFEKKYWEDKGWLGKERPWKK